MEVDRFTGKVVGLLGLGVFAAWIFGYEFRVWFSSPTIGEFSALLVLTAFFLTVFTVTSFAIKGVQVMAAGVILQIAAVWASLDGKFSVFTLIGLGTLFVFLVAGFVRGRSDILNSVKIRFFRISYRMVTVATTGFVLFFVFYLVGSLNLSQTNFHRGTIDFLLGISESATENIIPGFSRDKSIDDVLRAFIRAKAPAGMTEAEIQLNIVTMKEEIRKATGFRLDGRERFSEALYELTVAKFSTLAPAYQTLMIIFAGIVIFGFVKGLAFFLNIIVVLLAFVAYQTLIALNIITVRLESANREVITVE